MFAAMYLPMLAESDSDDLGSDNEDELDLETMYAIEQLTRPGLNEAKNDSEESLLPAVYRLGELLEQRPTANGGLQTQASGSQRSHQNVSNKYRPKTVESLLDMAARCVAKACSCKDLEYQPTPLDESLLCKVAYWSFPQDIKQVQAVIAVGETKRGYNENLSHWSKGTAMYRNCLLKEMWQVGFMLTAYIHKYDNYVTSSNQNLEVRVSLTFEKQCIMSGSCSDCKEGIWCPHMVCAAVYRIKHPDKVRVHAPMTETLSTLSRDQLQKMLQYAVHEDPAGILGKLFKYLDNIRDSNSELNSIKGAPDPTFGTLPTEKTTWQLSLEEFERNFTAELKNFYGGFYGGNVTYEISGKLKQPVNRYIRTILDLVQAGDVMAAISALNRITECAIALLRKSGSGRGFDRFLYELTRLYTQFMLYFGHQDEYKKMLLTHIKNHQKSTKSMERHKVSPSNWADLPSIIDVCKYVPEESLKHGLFTEPLSAQKMTSWPTDLIKLLNGEVSVGASTYVEDVRLMLARLECILTLEESSLAYKKAGLLSACILRVMTKAALADSVLGVKIKLPHKPKAGVESFSAFDSLISSLQPNLPDTSSPSTSSANSASKETWSTTPANRETGPKRSARKRRVASWCAQQSVASPQKKAKKSVATSTSSPSQKAGNIVPLKEGALGYAMLYCCCNVIMCERWLQDHIEDEDVMAGFCSLALEISRFRWMGRSGTAENESAENRCLEKLERLLHSYLVAHPKSAKRALQMYIQMWKHGVTFYEGLYPLVLTDVIFSDRTTPSRTHWCSPHDLVQVSSEFILDRAEPYEKFRPQAGQNDANRYFKSFIVTFFSYLDIDNEDQMNLVLKVLGQFEKYSNGELLQAVKESIMYNTGKFRDKKPIIQKCFSICLTAMLCKGDYYDWAGLPGYWRSSGSSSQSDVSYLCGLIGKLGVPSLASLHGKWKKIFKASDLVTLVDSLKLREDPKELPPDAVQLLREYYKSQREHDVENSLALLDCYNTSSESYREVVKIILDNWQCFDAQFLFCIAKREQEVWMKESGSKRGKKSVNSNTLVPEAFNFVEKAIIKLSNRQEISVVMVSHLNWAYSLCMNGMTAGRPKVGLFEKVVKLMETDVKDSPAVLVSILSFAMKNPSVQQQIKPLYTCLFTAYRNFFCKAVGSPGTYKSVISGLKDALEKCTNCVPDGKSRFLLEVLRMLRTLHSGKKKLLRMLDESFGPAE